MMPDALRAFIAVPMPKAMIAYLQETMDRLRESRLNIRWIPASNIHLTLRFLGDIDPSRVPGISAGMDAAAQKVPPFSLTADGPGVFPNLRQARVIWIGLSGHLDRLQQLRAGLETGLAECGFREETRPFRAHLTIGRTRQRVPAPDIAAMLASLKESVSDSFEVDRITLYQSTLKPTGAVYHRLHTSALVG